MAPLRPLPTLVIFLFAPPAALFTGLAVLDLQVLSLAGLVGPGRPGQKQRDLRALFVGPKAPPATSQWSRVRCSVRGNWVVEVP